MRLYANVYAYARQQTTLWENYQNGNFLNVGSCIISRKWRICEEYMYMRTKTHRRKMYAAMECESVEISGLMQVRFELWSFENFPPQKRALIFRTPYLCTEEESYIGLGAASTCRCTPVRVIVKSAVSWGIWNPQPCDCKSCSLTTWHSILTYSQVEWGVQVPPCSSCLFSAFGSWRSSPSQSFSVCLSSSCWGTALIDYKNNNNNS